LASPQRQAQRAQPQRGQLWQQPLGAGNWAGSQEVKDEKMYTKKHQNKPFEPLEFTMYQT